jgi:hypothetical protein
MLQPDEACACSSVGRSSFLANRNLGSVGPQSKERCGSCVLGMQSTVSLEVNQEGEDNPTAQMALHEASCTFECHRKCSWPHTCTTSRNRYGETTTNSNFATNNTFSCGIWAIFGSWVGRWVSTHSVLQCSHRAYTILALLAVEWFLLNKFPEIQQTHRVCLTRSEV